jgi:hypothetical protein
VPEKWAPPRPRLCRLGAILNSLQEVVTQDRQSAIAHQRALLLVSIDRSFADPEARDRARQSDRQGIGGRQVSG